jgi:autotransporter-associated beta strand protein
LERLEDRTLLAVDIWVSNGGMLQNQAWSNPKNWSTGVVPKNGDTLVFPFLSNLSVIKSLNNDLSGLSLDGLEFTDQGYIIAGNDITLTSGVDATNSTGTNEIDLNITLAMDMLYAAGSQGTDMIFGGTLQLGTVGSPVSLTIQGNDGELDFNNAISGFGSITQASEGTTVFSGPGNTYSGATDVQSGTLGLAAAAVAVPGDLTIVAAAVTFDADNQLAQTASVTVTNAGQLNLNGHSNQITNLSLSTGEVDTAAGTLSVSGNITATSGNSLITGNLAMAGAGLREIIVTPSSSLTATAAIQGTATLDELGGGMLILTARNTYTGGTRLDQGTLEVTNAHALGTGTLHLVGGAFGAVGNSGFTIANNISLDGNVQLGGNAALSLTGAVTLTTNVTLTVTDPQGVHVNGNVTSSGGNPTLSKAGTGMLTLAGNNSIATTTVLAGVLEIDGQQPTTAVTVRSGAWLSGSGTVSRITVLAGGHLKPGAVGTHNGTLTAAVAMLTAGSVFHVVVTGGNPSGTTDLAVSGNVRITNSSLRLQVFGRPALHHSFVIIHDTGTARVIGTFQGLPQNARFEVNNMMFQINYHFGGGNNVVVTRIG